MFGVSHYSLQCSDLCTLCVVLRWSQQRLRLDQQEAELLTKINNLRRKVATQMMADSSLSRNTTGDGPSY